MVYTKKHPALLIIGALMLLWGWLNQSSSVDGMQSWLQKSAYSDHMKVKEKFDAELRVATEQAQAEGKPAPQMKMPASKFDHAKQEQAKPEIGGGCGILHVEFSLFLPHFVSAIDDMASETWDAADAFKELTKQQIFNVASAGMDRDAQLALAREMGVLSETALRQLTTLDMLREQFDTGVISASEYNYAVSILDETIKRLSSKDITINTFLNEYHRSYYETYSNPVPGEDTPIPLGGGGAMRPVQWFRVGEMGAAEDVRAGYGGYVATTNNYTMNINSQSVNANSIQWGFRAMELMGG